jgi:hypothetical protein
MNKQTYRHGSLKTSRVHWQPLALIIKQGIVSILVCLTGATTSLAAELPQYDGQMHLGVASCASGVCHGSVRPRSGTRVLQNEYVTWS